MVEENGSRFFRCQNSGAILSSHLTQIYVNLFSGGQPPLEHPLLEGKPAGKFCLRCGVEMVVIEGEYRCPDCGANLPNFYELIEFNPHIVL